VFCGLWRLWQIPAFVLVVHAAFDRLKENLLHRTRDRLKPKPLPVHWEVYPFLADQALHLLSLGFLAWWTSLCLLHPETSPFWSSLLGPRFLDVLVIAAGATLTVTVGGILIGMLVAPFLRELEEAKQKEKEELSLAERGLANGGKVIGQLERALIFLLVMVGQPAGIGFLIAAKSILRFGEIKDRQNRMEAEYIIIGTLMSFGYGLLTAYLTHFVYRTL